VRHLVGALACGGLAPRPQHRSHSVFIGYESVTKLRQVAAGQSADNRGPQRGSRAGVAAAHSMEFTCPQDLRYPLAASNALI